jgi:hypothetical protein
MVRSTVVLGGNREEPRSALDHSLAIDKHNFFLIGQMFPDDEMLFVEFGYIDSVSLRVNPCFAVLND